MKPGYYIDMMDDLVVVYPDQTYDVYNIYIDDFVPGTVKLEDQSGRFILEFLGAL